MSFICITTFCVLVAMASASDTDPPRYYELSEAPKHFETFVKEYNREYKNDEDKEQHYQAFVKSLAEINRLNKANPSARYGINKFADYTDEEKKGMFGFKKDKN